MLGLVGFAGQIPTFLFAPLAGALVDRWNRHDTLVVTQVLAMIQSALLAYFTLNQTITVYHVLALNIFQGCINAFDMPARQAFSVDMLESKQDLPNAIALNSSMNNVARLLGPSAAGLLIAGFGEGGCFTIDAISYIAVIASLLMMHLPKKERVQRERKIWSDMAEGVRYATHFRPVLSVLLMLALVSMMGMPYQVLMPLIVSEKLHGTAMMLGLLTGASGIGALAGVLYLASRTTVLGLGRVIWIAAGLFGIGLMGIAISPTTFVTAPFMVITGMGMMVTLAAGNTILQTIVTEDKRGRVMALYTMCVAGMVPFGSLFSGFIARVIGAPSTIFVGGLACTYGAFAFYRQLPRIREQVRPIYRDLGILVEASEGT